jgi:hypothetical protein
VRFTILASPGSDPGDAQNRASAVVAVEDAAALAAAARASDDPFFLLLARGARPRSGAFAGLSSLAAERLGVLGGAACAGGVRRFGWMLAPVLAGPLPFELVPVAAPLGEAGIDARVRGPIDVVAAGMVLAARELVLEPLPADPVAALVELCARARAAGLEVVCRPSLAFDGPDDDRDDRGRAAALRVLAERRPELTGTHRRPAGARSSGIPPVTVLVHGPGAELAARRAREFGATCTARAVADPAAALRDEMRIRGERFILLAEASNLPDRAAFEALVESLASPPSAALAAPSAAALDGRCVLIAAQRFPQHIEPGGSTLGEAVATLVRAAHALRRGVRAPGTGPLPQPPPRARTATIVLAAASTPEILRLTATAVVESTHAGDELVAAVASGATTTRRILAAYPQMRIVDDAVDPLLADAVNRVAGAARGELLVFVADDVLVSRGALDRLREAFVRVPSLGAAFPAVPGAAGGEGVIDAEYADIAQLHALAEVRGLERAHDLAPIDVAGSPVFAVAREALAAVGGIDPAHGPTRRGIADLVTRLRAAGYGVVRCDDALVHRFDPSLSHNPAGAADLRQPVPVADAAAIARGFDPARRVPFVRDIADVPAPAATHVIAVPVAVPAELERAAAFLAAAAAAFDAGSPVRVDVLLDGTVSAADAVARVRPVLAASGKPLDATLAVRIEARADLDLWLAALGSGVLVLRAEGHDRDALAGLTAVDARSLAALVAPVAG